MNWFRVYAEARNDAKLRSLSDAEHRVWFDLLCFASEQEERGTIAIVDFELLALEVAHGDIGLLNDTLGHLARLRIVTIVDDVISFLHWLERQYDKPSDQPAAVRERVQRHRAAQAPVTPPPAPNGMPPVPETPCNADVTPGNAHTQIQNREYSEEGETIPPTPQSAAAPAPPAAGAAEGRSPPKRQQTSVPKPSANWDFAGLWALIEAQQGYRLTWNFTVQTQAVKRLLTAYPGAQPADFARFLAYVGTCWPCCDEPTRQPTFSEGAKHFGAWYSGGQPATYVGPPPKGPRYESASERETRNLRDSALHIAQLQARAAGDGDREEPPTLPGPRPGFTVINGYGRRLG